MSVRLIRESSETPNITNKDDAVMLRYAYGGYNGIVKSYGNQLSAKNSTPTEFKIGSGRLVIQGWEIEVEESGWTYAIPNISGTYYYTIYASVDVELEMATIQAICDSSGYSEVDLGEDLTQSPYGSANLVLYRFIVNNGVLDINSILAECQIISYESDLRQTLTDGTFKVKNALNADIAVKANQDSSGRNIIDTYAEKSLFEALSRTTRLTEAGFYYGQIFSFTEHYIYNLGLFYWDKTDYLYFALSPTAYVIITPEGEFQTNLTTIFPYTARMKVDMITPIVG